MSADSTNKLARPELPQGELARPERQKKDFEEKDIVKIAIAEIDKLSGGFKTYNIRKMVEHTQKLGYLLQDGGLKTNQIRKFLDAVNRIKVDLRNYREFSEVEPEIVLLKPKLAYAAARQKSAKPLGRVISKAIEKVFDFDDFKRLVQFIESIFAYHKDAGGQ